MKVGLLSLWLALAVGAVAYSGISVGQDIQQLHARRSNTYVGSLGSDSVIGRRFERIPIVDLIAGRQDTLGADGEPMLLLIYSITCGPCNSNMPSWIDIIAQTAGRDAEIVAISRHESPDARRSRFLSQSDLELSRDTVNQRLYWRELVSRVRVVVPVRDSMLLPHYLYRATPATILVRDGRVAATFVGPLSTWQESWLIRSLRGDNLK